MVRKRLSFIRNDWQKKVEDIGFHFYEIDGSPYWDESVYYEFTSDEIDHLEYVTQRMYTMCLDLVHYVIGNKMFDRFNIPERFAEYIKESWENREPSLYGRFDFRYDGKSEPKLLEFNADTPTALFEASVVQYYWLQDFDASKDQFNSIHEKLMEVIEKTIKRTVKKETFYFSCVKDTLEDFTTTEYLRDVAMQNGLNTEHIFIDDIGYDFHYRNFSDLDERPIRYLFKLYPWEWMIREEFADHLTETEISLFEPPWKMILSNKAILPLLWEMYPNHENLLPAYFSPPNTLTPFVEKPFFSREGEDIFVDTKFTGHKEHVVYQAYNELPDFYGNYPVVGSWIIGDQSAGIGIREDTQPITNNQSRFVPHLFF